MKSYSPIGLTLMALCAVLVTADVAWAHKFHVSKSRWRVTSVDGQVYTTITLDKEDTGRAANLKNASLPSDPQAQAVAVKKLIPTAVAALVGVNNDGEPCKASPQSVQPRKKGFDVRIRWSCKAPLTGLSIDLNFLPKMKEGHRHMARFDLDGQVESNVFSRVNTRFETSFWKSSGAQQQGQPTVRKSVGDVMPPASFVSLMVAGIEHIGTGWDHILFLLALLAIGGTFRYLVMVVTAFTVAHSITLAVAYLGWLSLSPAWVEAAIAATIVYVALENLWHQKGQHRWKLTFVFGLIHGFGFAGFLSDLNVDGAGLWMTLAAFNLGVELGQLGIVAVCFPLIHWASKQRQYREWVVYPLSVLVASAGLYWLVERTVGA